MDINKGTHLLSFWTQFLLHILTLCKHKCLLLAMVPSDLSTLVVESTLTSYYWDCSTVTACLIAQRILNDPSKMRKIGMQWQVCTRVLEKYVIRSRRAFSNTGERLCSNPFSYLHCLTAHQNGFLHLDIWMGVLKS